MSYKITTQYYFSLIHFWNKKKQYNISIFHVKFFGIIKNVSIFATCLRHSDDND